MTGDALPRIRALQARAVSVPFRRKPVTAMGAFERAPLVLLDLETDAGLTGRAYLITLSDGMLQPTVGCAEALVPLVEGQPCAPADLEQHLRARLRLLDLHGILGQVLAGIDMCAWDVAAQAAGMPLARLLGSALERVPAYNSCGLWLIEPDAIGEEAAALVEEGGFGAVKLRLGRADPAADLAAVRSARSALSDGVALMSDYNQTQTANAAIARGRGLDDEGLYWIEEPIRHDDYRNCARVAAALATPVQIGENLRDTLEMDKAIAAHAADYYMPDVQRIGGVTGWLRAAALAHTHDLDLSSHLFPEVSVHLLAASPTRHWLEWVDWASPILETPLEIRDGHALVPDGPGHGLRWDESAVARYAFE